MWKSHGFHRTIDIISNVSKISTYNHVARILEIQYKNDKPIIVKF